MSKPHLKLDGYKCDHRPQYPNGTTCVYSNLTARTAKHANMPASFDNKVVWVGFQAFAMKYFIKEWKEGFFNRPRAVVMAEYKRRMDNYLGPDAVDVEHIGALHDLGYLPIRIKAQPEGTRVDIGIPLMTIVNTHPDFFWLVNYLETVMSTELWKPITVATIAYEYLRILNKYVELTGSDAGFADWQIHDFSMRGMSGYEDAASCGAAHLMAAGFGTDCLPAIDYLEDYYGADSDKELVAGSVPATEHSVMCMGGMDTEIQTFRRLITEIYPSGIVSIVSDTWDFWKVITVYTVELKEEILARKPNALGQAKVVFRPDSGDPVKIVTGLIAKEITSLSNWDEYDTLGQADVLLYEGKYYTFDTEYDRDGYSFERFILGDEVPEHEVKGAVECLWDVFGGTVTDKGFKTLHERVGLIYGDSITLGRAEEILKRLMDKGFSAGNIVFGVGSYTYQYVTRDTFGMAMKATYGVVNGEPREIQKDPKTGDGVKKSAKGLLSVQSVIDVQTNTKRSVLVDQCTHEQEESGLLQVVFDRGGLTAPTTLPEIRARLNQ